MESVTQRPEGLRRLQESRCTKSMEREIVDKNSVWEASNGKLLSFSCWVWSGAMQCAGVREFGQRSELGDIVPSKLDFSPASRGHPPRCRLGGKAHLWRTMTHADWRKRNWPSSNTFQRPRIIIYWSYPLNDFLMGTLIFNSMLAVFYSLEFCLSILN